MKTPLQKLLILCCALYLSGAHWMLLQSTAWTGMLISRSIHASVSEALETTFDGQHPCRMCSAIADAKQTEQQSEKNMELLKKTGESKFIEMAAISAPEPVLNAREEWPVCSLSAVSRIETPPTPPPLG